MSAFWNYIGKQFLYILCISGLPNLDKDFLIYYLLIFLFCFLKVKYMFPWAIAFILIPFSPNKFAEHFHKFKAAFEQVKIFLFWKIYKV